MKQEPRAEPNQDEYPRRSSYHTSGAEAPEETGNEEDRAKPHYVYRLESCKKTSCRGNQPANDSVLDSERGTVPPERKSLVSHSPHKDWYPAKITPVQRTINTIKQNTKTIHEITIKKKSLHPQQEHVGQAHYINPKRRQSREEYRTRGPVESPPLPSKQWKEARATRSLTYIHKRA